MKNNFYKILYLLSLFSFVWPSIGLASNPVAQLEQTPLPKITIPPIKRHKLKNGMKLLLLADSELPVVRGTLYIRTGSLYDPPNQVGLAALTGQLLRSGGTQKLNSRQFNARLDELGAQIQSEIQREYGTVSFRCLKEDFPEVLGLVFQMLRQPAFEEKKLQLLKLQMIEGLRRQNDRPLNIAMREFPKLVYGPDNEWSRTPTVASIQSITRQDVLDFYQKFFFPNRMLFALSGDFSNQKVIREIGQVTQGWKKATQPLPKIAKVQRTWEAGVYWAQKGTDQTTLLLGHFGEKRFNPDKFALLLLNDVLGGDIMNSRLGQRIRSSLGLAYGIYSRYGFETDYGVFYIMAQTKAPSTRRVLGEIRKILTEVVNGETLTEQELEEHKRSVLSSLYSEYEPRFNFVKNEARFEYLGYPANYLQYFAKKIEQVTLADLRRVAKKYLKPDALKVLVVGDEQKVGKLKGAQTLKLDEF